MTQDVMLSAAAPAGCTDTSSPAATATKPATASPAAAPRVFDTYAVLYGLSLVFLIPGAVSIGRLAFRDYTFAYVSLVTVPFVLGLLATLFTDSRDPIKTQLIRAAVLVPLITITGVTVLFTSSFIVLPISQVLTPREFNVAGPIAMIALVVLASPLVPAAIRRLRLPLGWRSLVQLLGIVLGIAVVAGVIVLSLRPDRTLATMERKDVMIYIIGALVWYLPSFGVAAGVWRRIGLV